MNVIINSVNSVVSGAFKHDIYFSRSILLYKFKWCISSLLVPNTSKPSGLKKSITCLVHDSERQQSELG